MCSVKAQNGQTFEHTHGNCGAQMATRPPADGNLADTCREAIWCGVRWPAKETAPVRLRGWRQIPRPSCAAPFGLHKKAPTLLDRGAGALREAAIGAVSAAGRAGALSGERLIGAAPGQKNSAPGTVCEMPGAQCHLPEGWRNGILKISRGRGGRLFSCLYHTSRRGICHPTAP